MPWVDKERCVGCGICVEKCPADAITMDVGKAEINMEKCIRCGKCHEFCPQKAVRHDSEKIPQEVDENLNKTKELMKHFDTKEEKNEFLNRMMKHFNKEKLVTEKTIERIKVLAGDKNEENV